MTFKKEFKYTSLTPNGNNSNGGYYCFNFYNQLSIYLNQLFILTDNITDMALEKSSPQKKEMIDNIIEVILKSTNKDSFERNYYYNVIKSFIYYYQDLLNIYHELKEKGMSDNKFLRILGFSEFHWITTVRLTAKTFEFEEIRAKTMLPILKQQNPDVFYKLRKDIKTYVKLIGIDKEYPNISMLIQVLINQVDPIFGRKGVWIALEIISHKQLKDRSDKISGSVEEYITLGRENLLKYIIDLLGKLSIKPKHEICGRLLNCLILTNEYNMEKDEVKYKSSGADMLRKQYNKIVGKFDKINSQK